MKNIHNQTSRLGGFTVVETMIVLGVTSFLLVAVATTFNRQQGRTQFVQAAREMESRVQDVLNDVSTGYFPSSGAYTCQVSAGAITFNNTSTEQGKNYGCIFIGRVIQFNESEYRVFSVAGKRLNSGGQDVKSLTDADPTTIAPDGTPGTASWPDATEESDYPNGLTVQSVTYGSSNIEVDGPGLFSAFGDFGTGSLLKSGSLGVDMFAVGTSSEQDKNGMVGVINALPDSDSTRKNPTTGITVCMESGTSDQSAILKIGGNSSQTATDLVIRSGPC